MTLLFSFLFFITTSWSEFQVPTLTAPVVDQADVLSPNLKSDLDTALKNIKASGGPQITVLVVSSIDPLTIEEAAIRVAKKWGLGTADKDNGVLLMVAYKERKVRIEVGQGLEGDLTDAYSRRIIDQNIVPAFRSGDYDAGIAGGIQGILLRMDPPLVLEDYLSRKHMIEKPRQGLRDGRIYLIVLFLLLIFFLGPYIGGGGGRGYRGGGYYGGGFGGSGGGFGGGWSGGGGGFSGGGSSGSW